MLPAIILLLHYVLYTFAASARYAPRAKRSTVPLGGGPGTTYGK